MEETFFASRFAQVRDRFGIELSLQSIFKAPTIKKFAEVIDQLLIKEPKFVND